MIAASRFVRASLALLAAVAMAGCTAVPPQTQAPASSSPVSRAVVQPVPAASAPLTGPASFVVAGELTQGGWIRGQVPAGTRSARLGDQQLAVDANGRFFAAFDRDAAPRALLSATLADGRIIETPVMVSPREWNIERVNVARRAGGATEAFLALRRPELAQIAAARQAEAPSNGWRQDFIWPVKGRISGRFGSQRIYRGEPGSYHSGIDISTGTSGTPYVAPADGVVTLATPGEFSLEGKLLIIDHGQGLNSAFLHSSALMVRTGDTVRQGQHIGNIGASGRATGPHLHWSLMWRDTRLDPLLFTGPME